MMMNIDAGFVELLNRKTGANLSWQDFTAIYRERKAQRDADPVVQARRRLAAQADELDDEMQARIEAAQRMLANRARGQKRLLKALK